MVLGFFQNACILIASMNIIQHFLRDKKISREMSLKSKFLWGIYNGMLGIILMINSVPTTSETFIDFRYVPILISALYSGFLSSMVASILIGIFRFLILGISNISLIGLIIAILMGIGFGIISLLKLSKKNQYICCMLIFIILSVSSSFVLPVIQNAEILFKTMILYYLGYFIVSYLSIKYADYILEIIKIYQRLKNEATKDYLTGLNNVRQFDNSFDSISQMAMRKEEELSMLLIDIDFFKKINDTYGHDAGDAVLRGLAPIFINSCRTYDVVSRMGGEEFSILLLDCSETKAVKIAERLREDVENNDFYIYDNKAIKVTISIGISSYPKRTSEIDNLLKNADTALYEAKNNGRNKAVLFNYEKNKKYSAKS